MPNQEPVPEDAAETAEESERLEDSTSGEDGHAIHVSFSSDILIRWPQLGSVHHLACASVYPSGSRHRARSLCILSHDRMFLGKATMIAPRSLVEAVKSCAQCRLFGLCDRALARRLTSCDQFAPRRGPPHSTKSDQAGLSELMNREQSQ